MLDRRKFLEQIVFASPELFNYLHICISQPNDLAADRPCPPFQLKYFKKQPAPSGWLKVKDNPTWSNISAIVSKTTLIGMINDLEVPIYQTDSVARWSLAYASGLFGLYDELLRERRTSLAYLRACLDTSLAEGVQLVEFRRSSFGSLFEFDAQGNELPISQEAELAELTAFKQAYAAAHPDFIDFIFIVYGTRKSSKQSIKFNLEQAVHGQALYPELVRGFDLVGEEDLGHTLLFHRDTLMEGYNVSLATNHSFSMIFHAAETNWPSDAAPSMAGDDVSTLDNAYGKITNFFLFLIYFQIKSRKLVISNSNVREKKRVFFHVIETAQVKDFI